MKCEIDAIKLAIDENSAEIENITGKINESADKINKYNEEKENLLSAKGNVDESLLKIMIICNTMPEMLVL